MCSSWICERPNPCVLVKFQKPHHREGILVDKRPRSEHRSSVFPATRSASRRVLTGIAQRPFIATQPPSPSRFPAPRPRSTRQSCNGTHRPRRTTWNQIQEACTTAASSGLRVLIDAETVQESRILCDAGNPCLSTC